MRALVVLSLLVSGLAWGAENEAIRQARNHCERTGAEWACEKVREHYGLPAAPQQERKTRLIQQQGPDVLAGRNGWTCKYSDGSVLVTKYGKPCPR